MIELRAPVIIVNFKGYPEVEGAKATALASICEDVARRTGAAIIVCPPMVELSKVASSVAIPVFAQHVDAKAPGSITGYVSPQSVKAAGAKGTLLNHAEHRLPFPEIASLVDTCRGLGLISVVCADTAESAAAIASLSPDYIAVEPPELIGGDVSVTTADPQVVRRTVELVKGVDPRVRVLCGAGVKGGRDVRAALALGAEGVLLASGVVKAKDARAALLDLVPSEG